MTKRRDIDCDILCCRCSFIAILIIAYLVHKYRDSIVDTAQIFRLLIYFKTITASTIHDWGFGAPPPDPRIPVDARIEALPRIVSRLGGFWAEPLPGGWSVSKIHPHPRPRPAFPRACSAARVDEAFLRWCCTSPSSASSALLTSAGDVGRTMISKMCSDLQGIYKRGPVRGLHVSYGPPLYKWINHRYYSGISNMKLVSKLHVLHNPSRTSYDFWFSIIFFRYFFFCSIRWYFVMSSSLLQKIESMYFFSLVVELLRTQWR